ncbi:probable cation-transporting ATPase 13A3 [Gigantopelta aegis]|uniref:probable cation-transporting ATPase 13A3 n=1 Tax=Gigantopelta aegis TaxID=1735272 RepID=UPI001B88CFCD|nr:probable cation-transporting ATPase 13A3 [Gigantopelta aegis]
MWQEFCYSQVVELPVGEMFHMKGNEEKSGSLTNLFVARITINKGEEDELDCRGYTADSVKTFIFYILVLLTGGLLLLVVNWKPELHCYLKKRVCALYCAELVLIKDKFGNAAVIPVQLINEEDIRTTEFAANSYHGVDAYPDESDTAVLTMEYSQPVRFFEHQHTRYFWDHSRCTFNRIEDLSTNVKCVTIHDEYHGITEVEQKQKLLLHGPNSIDVEVKSYWRLFIEEVLNPFYIFQVVSIILWVLDEYYYYSAAIFFISVVSISISLYEMKRQSVSLRNMVSTSTTHSTVCRKGQKLEEISTRDLVPGDLIAIPAHGCVMTCDAVLVAGTCIVNESMLTGESVPVTKTPLSHQEDEEVYSPLLHKRHTLFAGTHIVQTRYYGTAKVMAVVVRTGFNTAKGSLIRGILFPKPLGFKFYQDAMRFILFLAGIAVIGMIYSLIIEILMGAKPAKIVLRCLDIITIVVPPALPAAMTVGTVYAQSRLKKSGIFCISPPRINFCGRINTFCFDKTGTLTEDGLDMWGVVPALNQCFQDAVRDVRHLPQEAILVCMATCHSLTLIDGEMNGDPLDLIMFNSIGWTLEEPGQDTTKYDTLMPTIVKPCTRRSFHEDNEPFEVGIVRQFPFSSTLQRMTVITRTLRLGHMEVYSKGAPEMIASLCVPETVPENFHPMLHKYSVQGFRVIALAYRSLDSKVNWHQVQRISRDKVERDLTFLGLLVLQNQLKPQTGPVIRALRAANIRTVMVTGDMTHTAISVARNCGMIPMTDQVCIVTAYPPDRDSSARVEWEYAELPSDDTENEQFESELANEDNNSSSSSTHLLSTPNVKRLLPVKAYQALSSSDPDQRYHLAVSGKSFATIHAHFPELLSKICVKGTVFARMSPDQKCQLIEHLQTIGYIVGMCGDGANDCEALKAAHAGISLSEAEASVAAPFTSRIPHIECVITAIREGRAALVTSFGCFKYMALYSFIQFASVLILYTFGANLSDFEFLYIDLIITLSIAVLMGYTKAYDQLVGKKPPGSLVKVSNLVSIVMQVVLVFIFQVTAYLFLRSQSWYVEAPANKDLNNVNSWESTVIFLVSSYMYVAVAFCFSKGPPFRKPIWTNYPFLIDILILFGFSTFLLMYPVQAVEDFFEMKPLHEKPMTFRLYLFGLAVGFAVVSNILEVIIVESALLKPLYRACKRRQKTLTYKAIQKQLNTSDWPPVGQVTFPTTNGCENVNDIHIVMDSERAVH